MANEFIARNGVVALDNSTVSGSLTVIGPIIGSVQGTGSWATNSLTASSADNFTVRGTLTAQTIVAQTITSSTDFVTGSTRFGSSPLNTHQFTGSVGVSGNLSVNGDTVTTNTASQTLTNKTIAAGSNTITGLTNDNLSGTAGISNANLANSSVTITAGTGLSGGGAVSLGGTVTLSNAGVTSNLAGTGISVNQSTGAVTITNTGLLGVTAGTGISISTVNQNSTITNTGVTSFNTRTGAVSLSSTDVTTALGYTPVTNARTLTINGVAYDLSADRSWSIAAGVTSFNTRTGAITLTSSDVTTALGYTPYNSTNPNGYTSNTGTVTSVAIGTGTTGTDINISGSPITTSGTITINIPTASSTARGLLSSTDWSTFNGKQAALNGTGFVKISGTTISYDNSTYYLTSNPSGYTSNTGTVTSVSGTGTVSGLTLSGTVTTSGNLTLGGSLSLTSGQITTGLGYTPYNSTNPSGYITGLSFDGLSSKTGGTGTYQTSGDFRAPIFYDSNNTAYYFYGSSTGDSIRVAGDVVAYYSDARLKDIKENIPNALEKLMTLDGFYYEPNEIAQSFGYEKKLQVGLSAQQVEAILPEIIKDAPIGNGYKTVDYSKLVPLLVEAIKEQQSQIEELKAKLG